MECDLAHNNPLRRAAHANYSLRHSAHPIFCLGRVGYSTCMRTADDFNAYYANHDPWGFADATFRDRVLRAHLTRATRKKTVLELGCGEGHLTLAVFHKARSVTAIDISDVAIARAKSLNLRNARFETADLMDISFRGYDVIAAIECVQYLSYGEQEAFLRKVASEHSGKLLFLSGPIIDYQKHFGHRRLLLEFRATGFRVVGFHNLSVYWHPLSSRIVGDLLKLPLGHMLLDRVPERMIHQRLYALRAP
jgi:cyclopropane fatty-acyl-phospholipid synthase-like methyltransferase